jgi:hypothetical protein
VHTIVGMSQPPWPPEPQSSDNDGEKRRQKGKTVIQLFGVSLSVVFVIMSVVVAVVGLAMVGAYLFVNAAFNEWASNK